MNAAKKQTGLKIVRRSKAPRNGLKKSKINRGRQCPLLLCGCDIKGNCATRLA
jgi:hypothetical protein